MDPVSTNFPKMGKTNAHARNVSGKASPNTTTLPRGGSGVGGSLEAVMAPSRRHTAERLGSIGMPQTSFAPKEDPSASANQRNMRTLPAAVSYNDGFAYRGV